MELTPDEVIIDNMLKNPQDTINKLDGTPRRMVPKHSTENLHVDFKQDENYQELPTTADSILEERGKRYGLFKDHANITQQLKDVMRNFNKEGWARLSNSQREALEMVQHKIGRILNGDPNYDDSWQDIIGYTQLVLDEIHGHTR